MALVLVLYDFDYTAKDGRLVSIKPNESYILVCKTNEHWWRVRRDQRSRPFYVPAQYVKEIPDGAASPEGGRKTPVEIPPPEGASGASGEDCRLSTHGFCWDTPEPDGADGTRDQSSSPSFNSQNGSSELHASSVSGYRKQSESSLQDRELQPDDDCTEFPAPPDLPELDLAPEGHLSGMDGAFEAPEPEFQGELRWRAADGGSCPQPATHQVNFSC